MAMSLSPTPEAAKHWVSSRKYVPVYSHGLVTFWKHQHRSWFAVTYGCQWDVGLEYQDAAKELGECLVHQLACEGLLQ